MKRITSLAVLVFIVLLVALAPAWLLTDRLAALAPEFKVGPVEGSVWNGRIASLDYQGVPLQGLSWELDALGLLTGWPLTVTLEAPLAGKAQLALADQQSLNIRALSAAGDLGSLLPAVGLPTMGFSGAYKLELDAAQIAEQGCRAASGRFTLLSLQGDVAGIDSIAPLTAALSCQRGALRVELDGDNPVGIKGWLSLPLEGTATGQVRLAPPPQSPLYTSLSQLLGEPASNGEFVIRL